MNWDFFKNKPIFQALSSLLLIVFLCYLPALHGPFIFDDISCIVLREGIHFNKLSLTNLSRLFQVIRENDRPVAQISFALNYYLNGLDTFGYHLVNLLIHICNSLLVYLIGLALLNHPCTSKDYGEQAQEIAILAALLFAVHPVQTQAVSYIVQRMTLLSVFFFLLSFYFYVKVRTTKINGYWIVCILPGLLSWGSKQNAVTLPFCMLLYEYIFTPEKDKSRWRLYLVIMAILSLILLAGIYTDFGFFARLAKGYQIREFTMGQRLLTELRVTIHYLSLLVWPLPSRLNLDYDFPLSYSLLNPPATLYCLIAIAASIFIAVYWRKWQPLLSFSMLWFWLNLLPESSVYPLDLVYEHRVYLPSVGFFLLFSILLIKVMARFKLTRQVKTAIIAALLIPLCVFTWQRNKIWRDDELLWKDTFAKSPGKLRPCYNLADVYVQRNDFRQAIKYYQQATQLQPKFARAYNDMGYCYFYLGEVEKAVDLSLTALKYRPQMADAHYNLGTYYRHMGKASQAKAEFEKALQIDPQMSAAEMALK